MIGKLKRVSLREVWKHEASDFTGWLQKNLDLLNELLDFSLANAEREKAAGAFKVDLLAQDEDRGLVIIENQLEKSDHDHLGKLVTYTAAFGAKKAIWFVADPRPEHIQAIAWLNETSSSKFYLVKVEAVQIDKPRCAPLLTLIVGPSEEGRKVGETKKELAERNDILLRFWKNLLEKAKGYVKLHSNITPSQANWIGTSAGKRGLNFNYVVRQHESSVELYIDRGKDEEAKTKHIFDKLYNNKVEIESLFKDQLEWQRLEEKRACRIRKTIKSGGWKDESKWPQIHKNLIDLMMSLEKSLEPYVAKLKI
ncbi:DUF4268 domain-containing protein [Candidatus Acetothermia bacterium]|nr:DUF4268 domain-containing protein [Candidatus Acetothermia bacterium]MBI3642959.1 DUF4268 domain-containing protein [Candidatus Acetothermia bacterium]